MSSSGSIDSTKLYFWGGWAAVGLAVIIVLGFAAYLIINIIKNQQAQASYLGSQITTGNAAVSLNKKNLNVGNLTAFSVSGQAGNTPVNIADNINFINCYDNFTQFPNQLQSQLTSVLACYQYANNAGYPYFSVTNINNNGLGTCYGGTATDFTTSSAKATVDSTNCGTQTSEWWDATGWPVAKNGSTAVYQIVS